MIRSFNYHQATSVKETLSLLETCGDDYKIICGGQSLLILMRQGLVAPENLIDIKSVKEMSYIDFDPKNGLKIGATTIHREIEKSPLIKKYFPVLVEMEKNLPLFKPATGERSEATWLMETQQAIRLLSLSLRMLQ